MSRTLRRTVCFALLALLSASAVALAAGPKKGASYSGALSHGKELIALKVSKSGKTVTVNAPLAPLYCEGGSGPTRQITRAAAISANGSFKGSITYEFTPTHTNTARLYFSGRFSGKTVKGAARSEFGIASAEFSGEASSFWSSALPKSKPRRLIIGSVSAFTAVIVFACHHTPRLATYAASSTMLRLNSR